MPDLTPAAPATPPVGGATTISEERLAEWRKECTAALAELSGISEAPTRNWPTVTRCGAGAGQIRGLRQGTRHRVTEYVTNLRAHVAALRADVERLADDREQIGDRLAKSLADALTPEEAWYLLDRNWLLPDVMTKLQRLAAGYTPDDSERRSSQPQRNTQDVESDYSADFNVLLNEYRRLTARKGVTAAELDAARNALIAYAASLREDAEMLREAGGGLVERLTENAELRVRGVIVGCNEDADLGVWSEDDHNEDSPALRMFNDEDFASVFEFIASSSPSTAGPEKEKSDG